jgi:hypothetical protein
VRIPGINAVFHDPAAAVLVNGKIVAAAEEEPPTRWGPRGPGPHIAVWAGDKGDPHADRPHSWLLLITVSRVLDVQRLLGDCG